MKESVSDGKLFFKSYYLKLFCLELSPQRHSYYARWELFYQKQMIHLSVRVTNGSVKFYGKQKSCKKGTMTPSVKSFKLRSSVEVSRYMLESSDCLSKTLMLNIEQNLVKIDMDVTPLNLLQHVLIAKFVSNSSVQHYKCDFSREVHEEDKIVSLLYILSTGKDLQYFQLVPSSSYDGLLWMFQMLEQTLKYRNSKDKMLRASIRDSSEFDDRKEKEIIVKRILCRLEGFDLNSADGSYLNRFCLG